MTTSSPTRKVTRDDRTARWAVTLVATAVSTYALDVVAAAGGVLLSLSGALSGLDRASLVAVVALSYLIWAFGLRTALRANHALLEQAAVSTSVLSKLAWQIACRGTSSTSARRWASMAGYLAWELIKEIPYYVAAAGVVLIGDSLGVDDALIFLAGANFTAALYEYGIGTGTQAWLSRRRFSSFETDWDPRRYLDEYYRDVQADELHTIRFMVEAVRHTPPDQVVLVFGTGPTLHHVFPLAGRAAEIHLADYLDTNLDEIRRWLRRDPDAHDWRPFVRYTLQCEGIELPSAEQITRREERTRATVARLLTADARRSQPLPGVYDTVVSAYCADSATADRATWSTMFRNIAGLVGPGGTFVTAALDRCQSYVVGGKRFPGADVDADDIGAALDCWFQSSTVHTHDVPEHADQGYRGVVLGAGSGRLDPIPDGPIPDRHSPSRVTIVPALTPTTPTGVVVSPTQRGERA